MIKKLSSTTVYQNKWLSVREDKVMFDNKFEGIYSVLDKPDCVMIMPYDGEFFYLVRQYRYPIEKYFLEFPAGSHEESTIENEVQLVKDELEEETGWVSEKITKLGVLNEVPATVNQRCHMFLAENLRHGQQKLEVTESDLTIIKMTQSELETAIANGKVSDAKTLAGFLIWKLKKQLNDADIKS
ncbi:MAG TPA: NUDIX hydrolase [Vitreimonas sp.]|nr:NUDIX hydrolase [Vitreimonas sp.]